MELNARRQMMRVGIILAALALGLIAATGCYVRAAGGGGVAEFEVDAPPPPLQAEVVVTGPGPEFVWVPGFWDWDVRGRTWGWKVGRWDRPPRRGARWELPHFEERGGRKYYRRGHWR